MFLGFTRHGISVGFKEKVHLVTLLLIIWTLTVLTLMFDSYFLHSSKTLSVISPLQRKDAHSCAMSYAYPTFIEINQQPNSTFAGKYKLYLYREGYLDTPEKV
jgi:hypothetical protein